MKVNRILQGLAMTGLCLGIVACSSSHKPAGVESAFGPSVQTDGLGNEGPFVNSAYMAKVVGVDKNTIYFDFDKSYINPDYQYVIDANAKYLKSHPSAKVRLEGNTDPQGSREYNIGLGQRRAVSVAEQLEAQGVSSSQLVSVSYGQERPAMAGSTEDAYRLDRRVDLVYISQ